MISGGRVVALAERGEGGRADELIDARGLVALPGAIDMHAHFEDPGHTEREDFTTGTMSAAAGGITTVIEHPLTYPPVTTTALYREKREMASAQGRRRLRALGRAHPDLDPRDPGPAGRGRDGLQGLHAGTRTPRTRTSRTPSSSRACTRSRPSAASCSCTPRATRCCRRASRACGPRAAATRSPTTRRGRRSSRRRRCTARSTSHATSACGSRSCTSRAPSAPSSCARRSAPGRPATMEICPHHLLLDLDDLVRLGPYGVCAPALRERALVERLWDAVRDGTADCLVSDHAASTLRREGGRLGRHLRLAARLPGDAGDGAARARRGLPSPRHAARRLRALLVDQRGAHQRHVSAQGHAAARRRRRHRALRPRGRVAGRRREPAVLQEPVVAVRRPARACARRAHARARRDGLRRRRDPRRAGLRALPLLPRRLLARRRRDENGLLPRALPAQRQCEGRCGCALRGRLGACRRAAARARLHDPADALPGARVRRAAPLLGGARAVRHARLPRALPPPRRADRDADPRRSRSRSARRRRSASTAARRWASS